MRSFLFHKCSHACRSMAGWNICPSRSGAVWDDLDLLEFERFRRTIRESHGMGDQTLIFLPDREPAMALGAVDGPMDQSETHLLALLCFGKEESLRRFLPSHEVAFQELSEPQVVVTIFSEASFAGHGRAFGMVSARYRETEIQGWRDA